MDGDVARSIDEYISGYSGEIAERLKKLRLCISRAVPAAQEKMSYRMPTFYLYGNLVHFAAHRNHIGFYPAPSAIERFAEELRGYKTSKGAVQFPLDAPLPYELVSQMARFRAEENTSMHEAGKIAKRSKGSKPEGE